VCCFIECPKNAYEAGHAGNTTERDLIIRQVIGKRREKLSDIQTNTGLAMKVIAYLYIKVSSEKVRRKSCAVWISPQNLKFVVLTSDVL